MKFCQTHTRLQLNHEVRSGYDKDESKRSLFPVLSGTIDLDRGRLPHVMVAINAWSVLRREIPRGTRFESSLFIEARTSFWLR